MNTMIDHWGAIKERLKQKYAHLSDNDLAYIKDREDEILLRIAEKTGASRDELDQQVREACGIASAPAPAVAA
jgi:hypothetical protein